MCTKAANNGFAFAARPTYHLPHFVPSLPLSSRTLTPTPISVKKDPILKHRLSIPLNKCCLAPMSSSSTCFYLKRSDNLSMVYPWEQWIACQVAGLNLFNSEASVYFTRASIPTHFIHCPTDTLNLIKNLLRFHLLINDCGFRPNLQVGQCLNILFVFIFFVQFAHLGALLIVNQIYNNALHVISIKEWSRPFRRSLHI